MDTRISVSTNFPSILIFFMDYLRDVFFQENVFNSTALIANCNSVTFTYFAFNFFLIAFDLPGALKP